MRSSTISVGDVIEVTTERLAYGGDAVARYDGLAVFVPLAAPGERLRVRITERKKSFARATIERVLEPSAFRRDPPCRYFGNCGGCQLQHLTYDAQLEAKVGFVRDALERLGRIDWPHEIKIRSSPEFGYRSRAQVKIDWKSGRAGFNQARSTSVCDVESCPILVPELNEALHSLRLAVGRPDNRGSHFSNIEVAAGESGVWCEPAIAGLQGGSLRQVVRDAIYNFDPSTFFQSNSQLLGELIDEAIAGGSGNLGIDLYAGVGLFTIQMARHFKRVVGVESDARAARFALQNITENQLDNVEFYESSVEAWLKQYPGTNEASPDFVLLDPPRIGAANSIGLVAKLKPARITYVSCDPATLARDLRVLTGSGYRLSRVTVIDLFPQTYHVETVVALTLS